MTTFHRHLFFVCVSFSSLLGTHLFPKNGYKVTIVLIRSDD